MTAYFFDPELVAGGGGGTGVEGVDCAVDLL